MKPKRIEELRAECEASGHLLPEYAFELLDEIALLSKPPVYVLVAYRHGRDGAYANKVYAKSDYIDFDSDCALMVQRVRIEDAPSPGVVDWGSSDCPWSEAALALRKVAIPDRCVLCDKILGDEVEHWQDLELCKACKAECEQPQTPPEG